MIQNIIYDSSQRQFSTVSSTLNKIISNVISTVIYKKSKVEEAKKRPGYDPKKDTSGRWTSSDVIGVGTPAIEFALESVENSLNKSLSNRQKYNIITNRNKTLNNLYDKFKENSEVGIIDKDKQQKYLKQLNDLADQTIKYANLNAYKDQTALESYVNPYIALLGTIGLKGVFFLPGISVGPDRRDFEIVFDPTRLDGRGLEKDPYRNVVFKYRWPIHGFEVPYSRCKNSVREFINSVNNFLSLNPKYLCIRI